MMFRLIGGPLDGKETRTRLPVVKFPFPNSLFTEPKTIESYERKGNRYFHLSSEPYPNLSEKLPEAQP